LLNPKTASIEHVFARAQARMRLIDLRGRAMVAHGSHVKGGVTMPNTRAGRVAVSAAAIITVCSIATATPPAGDVADAAGPGIIGVSLQLGPTVSAPPTIRLLHDATSDLWASNCVTDVAGRSTCSNLPPGSYTFEIVGAPAGVVLTPLCVPSTSGIFYPVEIGTTSAWATDGWTCDLYIAEPGVMVLGPAGQLPTLAIDVGSATCLDRLGPATDATTRRWCTHPSPGNWTITPSTNAPAGSTMLLWCRQVGAYANYGNYEYFPGTVSVTAPQPQWDCWVDYVTTGLTWRVADVAPDGPIVASSAWHLTDTATGTDRSGICTPVAPEPGILVAYTCPLPLGDYELTFDDPAAAPASAGCRSISLSQFTPEVTCDIVMPVTPSTEPISTSTSSAPPIATELPVTGRPGTPGVLLAGCLLAIGLVLTRLARRHRTA
jgi:hypothetical protein